MVSLRNELARIVGRKNVVDDPDALRAYGSDGSECPPRAPDLVVRPRTSAQVAALVKLARRRRVPLTPVAARTNGWGQHIPLAGGVVLDLSRLDRVVEINERSRYMVVEPGVTMRTVNETLARRGLWASLPKGCPAEASVVANLLMQGMGHMPLKFGAQSELINGLEVVLPDGDRLRCGSAACGSEWFAKGPLADFVGLFAGWYGSTGIVTKIGFPIFRRPARMDVLCLAVADFFSADLATLAARLIELDVADDLSGYTSASNYVGEDARRAAGPNVLYLYAIVTGPSGAVVKAKKDALLRLARTTSVGGRRVHVIRLSARDLRQYLSIPKPKVGFSPSPTSGSTNPCCYLPIAQWPRVMRSVSRLLRQAGLKAEFRLEAFRGSNYGSLMSYFRFQKGRREDENKAARIARRMVALYLDHGGMIWKAPPWALREQMARGDRGFTKLARSIKRMLDPQGIVHPGRPGF
jgi:glycolate oxidase